MCESNDGCKILRICITHFAWQERKTNSRSHFYRDGVNYYYYYYYSFISLFIITTKNVYLNLVQMFEHLPAGFFICISNLNLSYWFRYTKCNFSSAWQTFESSPFVYRKKQMNHSANDVRLLIGKTILRNFHYKMHWSLFSHSLSVCL